MSLRDRLKNLERRAEGETVVLVCPECDEEMRVWWNTSFEYLAWRWVEGTGYEAYRGSHPDVFVVNAHTHNTEALIDRATGEPWLDPFRGSPSPKPCKR